MTGERHMWLVDDMQTRESEDAPVLTEQDIPLGPFAGKELRLLTTTSGRKRHFTADCPHLRRSTPKEAGRVRLPEVGSLANLRAMLPDCEQCFEHVEGGREYVHISQRLLGNAQGVAEARQILAVGPSVKAFADVLALAENPLGYGGPSLDDTWLPAAEKLIDQAKRIAVAFRHENTSEDARQKLYLVIAARTVLRDIDKGRPGRLAAPLLDLAVDVVGDRIPDGDWCHDTHERLAVRHVMESWLSKIEWEGDVALDAVPALASYIADSAGPHNRSMPGADAVEQISRDLRHTFVSYLTGMIGFSRCGDQWMDTPNLFIVGTDMSGGYSLAGNLTRALWEMHPSAARTIDDHRYIVGILPKFLVQCIEATAPADRGLHVIGAGNTNDDTRICQGILDAFTDKTFLDSGGFHDDWWDRAGENALSRAIAKARRQ